MTCKIGQNSDGVCTLADGEYKGFDYGPCTSGYKTFEKGGKEPWTAEELERIRNSFAPIVLCNTTGPTPVTLGLFTKGDKSTEETATRAVSGSLAASSDEEGWDVLSLGLKIIVGLAALTGLGLLARHFTGQKQTTAAPPSAERFAEDRLETKIISLPEGNDGEVPLIREVLAKRFRGIPETKTGEMAVFIHETWTANGKPAGEGGLPPAKIVDSAIKGYFLSLGFQGRIKDLSDLMKSETPVVFDDATPVEAPRLEVVELPTDGSDLTLGSRDVEGRDTSYVQVAGNPEAGDPSKIAGEHAQLYMKDGTLWVDSLSPINGTYVVNRMPEGDNGNEFNHTKVAGDAMMLMNGDLLRLGDAVYEVIVPDAGAAQLIRRNDVEWEIIQIEKRAFERVLETVYRDNPLPEKFGSAEEESLLRTEREHRALKLVGEWRQNGGRPSQLDGFVSERLAVLKAGPGLGTAKTLFGVEKKSLIEEARKKGETTTRGKK
jgi:hypothetical protein